ncbi:hypothetical protein HBO38_35220 [Pseudomonas veronii]|uniref:Uncharacterized protein n=1 Tax=Pseudomonas veronii TaxID=76761 RepID=A0A7Y1AD56_PSEVE|nr:hypothetical protein [Pseudomonas veronii]NMY13574.1 hypothetical protein [Pseudomonas veronii]
MNSHVDWSFRETKVITVDEISEEHVFPERLRLKLANAKGYKWLFAFKGVADF